MFGAGVNDGLSLNEVIFNFNQYFNANYGANEGNWMDPTFAIKQLHGGYPMYGSFRINGATKGGHAVVIRGANRTAKTFSIMNPNPNTSSYNYTGTISSSNVWSYICEYGGQTYTMKGYGFYSGIS